MSYNRNEKIKDWIYNRASNEFAEDLSLVLLYGSYVNGTEHSLSDVDCYFIPKTEKGYDFSKSFIMEEVGYDIFPMTWDRVEGLADFKEVLTPCVGNAEILYYGSEEDREHFLELKDRLKSHLKDSEFMHQKACETYQVAYGNYGKMRCSSNLGRTRMLAGTILMELADSIAYYNQSYYQMGLKKQYEDLVYMPYLPEHFMELYLNIIQCNQNEKMIEKTRMILEYTKDFLECEICMQDGYSEDELELIISGNPDYARLAVLYEEISSTFNKIYTSSKKENYVLAFLSAVNLQVTLNRACEENGLEPYDLLEFYKHDQLEKLCNRAKEIQQDFMDKITKGGGVIKTFESFEVFVEAGI